MQYDPVVARRDVIALYAAIIAQAVKDYKNGRDRKGVIKFLNSAWGRSILDVLDLSHDVLVAKLKEEVENAKANAT